MIAELVGMGVVTALGHVINARGEIARDEPGHHLELGGQLTVGIRSAIFRLAQNGANRVARDNRIHRGMAEKINRLGFIAGDAASARTSGQRRVD